MPQQLIYTSAPRGLVAGRSGHCTVARSAGMREPLALRLEQLSYYQHHSLTGGQERPIFAARIVDIRGSRFHVLSRIQDAGLDFTGRTNFIAHHFVATPEEIRQLPAPAVILREWSGWFSSWTREPMLLEKEDWTSLTAIAGRSFVPAQTWQRVTGDAVNGYGLLEAKPGACFRADELADDALLGLLAESMELLELRDARKDFRNTAWQYTFTTSLQEQDNPADFRWRCLHAGNPAAAKTAATDCPSLAAVRANKCTEEELALARAGRQAPRFVVEPHDIRITEGETPSLISKAEGVPSPSYQWFTVDRANNGEILKSETSPVLTIANPAFGVSRYMVRAANSAGEVQSTVATLSVEQKLRLAQHITNADPPRAAKNPGHQKTDQEIQRQRYQLAAGQAEKMVVRRQKKRNMLLAFFALILVGSVVLIGWLTYEKWRPRIVQQPTILNGNTNVIFSVVAEGKEPLIYQWYKGDNAISNATDSRLDLSLHDFTNVASFYVSIKNPWGALTSAIVQSPSSPQNVQLPPTNAGFGENTKALSETDHDLKLSSEKKFSGASGDLNKLLAPWTNVVLGHILVSTLAKKENGKFILRGAGAQSSKTNDECFFTFEPVSNFKEFSARLILPIKGERASKLAGIMWRESEREDSPFVFIGTSASNLVFRTRPTAGGPYKDLIQMTNHAPKTQLFLKLSQTGTNVSGWFSSDGNFKNPISNSAIISISALTNCLVGFAVSSGNTSENATAEFDQIQIDPKENSAK